MTITMNPEDKEYLISELKKWEEKINSFIDDKDLNDFYSTVGLELGPFIIENETIQNEFYKRAEYFKRLMNDQEYKKFEENAIKLAVLMVDKIINEPKLLAEANKNYNSQLHYKLKPSENTPITRQLYSLTEFAIKARDFNYYYRLGDSANDHADEVVNQFPNIKNFIDLVDFHTRGNTTMTTVQTLLPEFNAMIYELKEKLYNIPHQTHIRDFGTVLMIIASFKRLPGHEDEYDQFGTAWLGRHYSYNKSAVLAVISDLISYVRKIQCNSLHKTVPPPQDKNFPKSLYLVTTKLETFDVIFLVFNELYDMPIRCEVKNYYGADTYLKKLYNIAYIVDAPGKWVGYDKKLADEINNGLFRRKKVKQLMRTNNFEKPTLVQKSEDKKSLVLKDDIQVKTILVKNIPVQYQSLYIDKTR